MPAGGGGRKKGKTWCVLHSLFSLFSPLSCLLPDGIREKIKEEGKRRERKNKGGREEKRAP